MSYLLKKMIAFTCYILGFVFITFGLWYIVFNNNLNHTISNENINLEKSVSINTLIFKTNSRSNLEPVFYSDVMTAITNSKYYPTSFKGKLTHYGPDCSSCGGKLGCNGQNALNGNIYYNDKEYGTLRVVATTKLIPCGSIIRINVKEYDPNGMYVIVLDRGVGVGVIDLLKESETSISPVRTKNNVLFDIVRYGY